MPRLLTRSLRLFCDLAMLSLAYWAAWWFRFEFEIPSHVAAVAWVTWPIVVGAHFAALVVLGATRLSWRYVSMPDVTRIVAAMVASTGGLFSLRFARALPTLDTTLPFSVLAIDFVLALVAVIAIRAAWRIRSELRVRKQRGTNSTRDDIILIGAGQGGIMVARELANRPDLGLRPIGFLDDNPLKVGTVINGIPVLGLTSEIRRIVVRYRVTRALITIAHASGPEIRRITELCRDAGVATKIIPGIHEIVGGKVNVRRFREVAIEDLLGRKPVDLDEEVVGSSLRSRVVLVTGAGGSIGAELCRQICKFGPERLILVERFENALFEIHRELATSFPHVRIEPRIADVCDRRRVSSVFAEARPSIVFHAAAHKHVPMMEWNPGEAVKNNVGGTRILAEMSDVHGVERFVLISTDKAVNPTSVMGATKRAAEIYLQAFSQRSSTRFVTVRFGNVLGSAGSVIPIFRQQIANGGPVLVTHPDMRRYFMTIPEASQLVLQAGAMGRGGEIFILDMGDPVRIVQLARDLITLSGLRPDEDIEIRFTGIRPGEKLFEELSTDAEHAETTHHPKVFVGRIQPQQWSEVFAGIEQLIALADGAEADIVRAALGRVVPEYALAHGSTSRKVIAESRASTANPVLENGDADQGPDRAAQN